MRGRYLLPILFVLSAVSAPRFQPMAYGQTVSGSISRGQMLAFQFPSSPHGLRVDFTQTDIDIAVQTGNVSVNSAEFGTERAYFSESPSGPAVVHLIAEKDGSRAGRFSLTVTPLDRALTPRLQAQRLEADGLAFMEPRRAETQQSAIDRLRAAADLWHEAGDKLREGNCRHWLGRALERIPQYRNADKQYEQAIRLLHESGDVAAELNARKTWMNLGGHVGESRGKLRDLEKLLESWRQFGDRRGVAMLSRSLAAAVRDSKDSARAKALLSDATSIWRDLGNSREVVDGLLRGLTASSFLRIRFRLVKTAENRPRSQ